MALSNDLISQFVKVTRDNEQTKNESTAYGKIVKQGDTEYVQLDGSDLLTPISSTTVVKDGDRVMVTIKNHTAIVTGDFTNQSASNKDVVEIGNKISEFEIVIADKVTTEQLEAEIARIERLRTEELEATNAKIETIEGKVAKIDSIETDILEVNEKITAHEGEFTTIRGDIADFKDVTAERVDAIEGDFYTLESEYANFKETTTNKITANEGSIAELETNKLSATEAELKYANIDFSNIGEAAIENLFSDSGIIKDLIMSDGKVTGELVGVTIKGDLIEGNTVKADKLVILGTDGLYYKLNVNALGETTASSDEKYQNGLDGSIIVAESITAEKIAVDDLVAFGATIGGFHITEDSLYSGVKESVSNTTQGIYLGDDGQAAIGNANNYLKFFVDEDGVYKLELQASSIRFGSNNSTIEEYVESSKQDIAKTVEGTELTIDDGMKISEFRVEGKSYQEVIDISEASKNLYNYKDIYSISEGMVVGDDGWVHVTYDNTNGTETKRFDQIINKSYRLKESTQYRIVCEYKVETGKCTLGFGYSSDFATQITTVTNDTYEEGEEGVLFYTFSSRSSFLYVNALMTTYVGVSAGEKVNISFRMSILEDTSITASTFIYEPYLDATPTPYNPSEIISVGSENSDGKYEIEVVHRGNQLIDFANPTGASSDTTSTFENNLLTVNSTSGTYRRIYWNILDLIKNNAGKTLYLDYENYDTSNANNAMCQIVIINNGTTTYYNVRRTPYKIPSDISNITTAQFGIWCNNTNTSGTYSMTITKPILQFGTDKLEYGPYFSNSTIFELDQPLRSLPNGVKDIVYLKQGKLYIDKYIGSITFDGSEDWASVSTDAGYRYYVTVDDVPINDSNDTVPNILCDRFQAITPNDSWFGSTGITLNATQHMVMICYETDETDTVDEFKTWLSENMPEVHYELTESITEEIGSLYIPMSENLVNIYYVNNSLTPYTYCKYYTEYPELWDIIGESNATNNDNLNEIADGLNNRISQAEATIELLSNMIANLVTDENGGSLMTQTPDGWTFNMSSISGNLNAIKDAMADMENDHAESNSALDKLTDLVNDVANKTAYITMSTDDNGDPCIELGKSDSLFKVRITNKAIDFLEGSTKIAYANNNTFYSEKIIVKNELQIGEGPGFVWRTRANGNMGLTYIPFSINTDLWNTFFKINSYNGSPVVNNNPTLTFSGTTTDSLYANLSEEASTYSDTFDVYNYVATTLQPRQSLTLTFELEATNVSTCDVGLRYASVYSSLATKGVNGTYTITRTNEKDYAVDFHGILCRIIPTDETGYTVKLSIKALKIS